MVILSGSVASLGGVALVLLCRQLISGVQGCAGGDERGRGLPVVAVCAPVFTTRYAKLCCGDGHGIGFNQPVAPTYRDFACLAFTVGMTFQVSDTAISDPLVRRIALRHALVSYVLGVVVIATTINLVAGLGKMSRKPDRRWASSGMHGPGL